MFLQLPIINHSSRCSFFTGLFALFFILFLIKFLIWKEFLFFIKFNNSIFYVEDTILLIFLIICYIFGPLHWGIILAKIDDRFINKELNSLSYIRNGKNLTDGFLLFLLSEILIFCTLFFVLFSYILSPPEAIGSIWPAYNFPNINVESIPNANTWLLISSSIFLGWVSYLQLQLYNLLIK